MIYLKDCNQKDLKTGGHGQNITVSYTRLVLTYILSFPRCLYFLEYVLFYTFLSCQLVVVVVKNFFFQIDCNKIFYKEKLMR